MKSNFDVNATDANTASRSWYASAAWQGRDSRIQFNLVDSQTGQIPHQRGLWLDGEMRDGRYRHNYGVFRLDPGIVWGYLPFIDDSQGGYYRVNYQSQQWLWTAGLDSISSVSGRGVEGLYSNASVRIAWGVQC